MPCCSRANAAAALEYVRVPVRGKVLTVAVYVSTAPGPLKDAQRAI